MLADPNLNKILEDKSNFKEQLSLHGEYFMKSIGRITKENFTPSTNDMLRLYKTTTNQENLTG